MTRKSKAKSSFGGSSPFPAMDKSFQAEDDHRTLMRAAEVTGDSQRMAGAKRHHKKVSRGLASVGKMMGGRR